MVFVPKDEHGKSVSCSFCGKNQDRVNRIIAGPGAYICNECVRLCVNILEDDLDIILLSNSGYGEARNDLAEILYDFCYHDGSEAGEQNEMDKGYI